MFKVFFGVFTVLFGLVYTNVYYFFYDSKYLAIMTILYIAMGILSLLSLYLYLERRIKLHLSLLPLCQFILFVFMPYNLVLFMIYDIYLLVGYEVGYDISRASQKGIAVGVEAFLLVMIAYGYYNSRQTRIKEYHIDTDKKIEPLRLGMVSDIHINSYRDKGRAERLADLLNKSDLDMVLLCGDTFDNAQIKDIKKSGNAVGLQAITSKYGTYACLGNHEFYGDHKSVRPYMESLGIRVLEDEKELIGDNVWIVGRKDYHDNSRAQLLDVLGEHANKFIICLDHQPHDLNEVSSVGVDIAMYGHTHNGQYFPFNLFVKKMYELPHGHKKKDNTNIFVSSGAGEWGAMFRLFTHSEIIIVNLSSNLI